MTELTPKQKRFVAEYLKDLNGKQAAIRSEYSAKTAEVQAARLLSNAKVQAAIAEAQAERAKRTNITNDRILQELAAIGFYDITDYANVEGNSVTIKDTLAIDKDKRAAIAGIKQTQAGIEVKMLDKLKALELMGRHNGMFKDTVTHEVEDLAALAELLK